MAYWTVKARITQETFVTVEAETEEAAKVKFEKLDWEDGYETGIIVDYVMAGSFKRDED